jgi:hypothetical protein
VRPKGSLASVMMSSSLKVGNVPVIWSNAWHSISIATLKETVWNPIWWNPASRARSYSTMLLFAPES